MSDSSRFAEFAAAIEGNQPLEQDRFKNYKGTLRQKRKQQIREEIAYSNSLRRYIMNFLPSDYDLGIKEYRLPEILIDRMFILSVLGGTILCLMSFVVLFWITANAPETGLKAMPYFGLGTSLKLTGVAFVVALLIVWFTATITASSNIVWCTKGCLEEVITARQELECKKRDLEDQLDQLLPYFKWFWRWRYFLKETLNARLKIRTTCAGIWDVALLYRGADGEKREETYSLSETGYKYFVHDLIALCRWNETEAEDILAFEEKMLGPRETAENAGDDVSE